MNRLTSWLRFGQALLGWPYEGHTYILRYRLVHHSKAGCTLTAPKGFIANHSSWSPNLRYSPKHPKNWQERLFGRLSKAQWLHDWAYVTQQWDCGKPMSWEEANAVMIDELISEGHPYIVIRLYSKGIQSRAAKKVWDKAAS